MDDRCNFTTQLRQKVTQGGLIGALDDSSLCHSYMFESPIGNKNGMGNY
jgi:hypothetical protein